MEIEKKIPADGQVLEGETSVNEAMLTGESKLVSKHVGAKIIGGSINGERSITAKEQMMGRPFYLRHITYSGLVCPVNVSE